MNVNFISPLWHEIFGIVISILIITHLILNFKWIKNITKNLGKVKGQIKLLYGFDILTFLSYLVTIVVGILISTNLFSFKTRYNPYLILVHYIFGRTSAIFMLIHLCFHLKAIISKFTKNETTKMVIYIIYITLSLLIAMYLFYTLTRSYIWIGIMGNL